MFPNPERFFGRKYTSSRKKYFLHSLLGRGTQTTVSRNVVALKSSGCRWKFHELVLYFGNVTNRPQSFHSALTGRTKQCSACGSAGSAFVSQPQGCEFESRSSHSRGVVLAGRYVLLFFYPYARSISPLSTKLYSNKEPTGRSKSGSKEVSVHTTSNCVYLFLVPCHLTRSP